MSPREAFETLGLPLTATPAEAKAAWHTLARTLHSDFHQDKEVEQREILENSLRRINAAYDFLKHFYDLPAAQRARMLGTLPVEPDLRPPPLRPAQPESRIRRKRARRTPVWVMVSGAIIPLAITGWLLQDHFDDRHETPSRTPVQAPLTGPAPVSGDPRLWIGKQVAIVNCAGKSACNDPDCAAGPLLKSLRGFYGFRDAWALYGTPDSQKTGLIFSEILPTLRPDHFSVRPVIVVADTLAGATRRIEGRRNPGNACRFTFGGPMTITGYAGPLYPETKSVGQEEEVVLQLDEIHQRGEDDDTMVAEFEEPESGRKYHFEYGFRRDSIEGPMVSGAPIYNSDAGSLYKVKFRRVEYVRNGELYAANHEFVHVTRLTGERESKQYLNTPLMGNPKKAIRALERVDLAGIRQCQTIVNDPASYTACAFRLIQKLEASGRINAMTSQDLRYRVRNLTME
ncbi:MAG: J domain-containing protein [Bryobacteraceae bacterium]|nr:J domain-containing protein [Bryobacteraceae bacterium]